MPRTLCIMPTFRCTAQCKHCGTFSHPGEKTQLSAEVMRQTIRDAADEGYEEVVFSGGEPTLALDDIAMAMKAARDAGLRVRLVTNGHWANDLGAALARVKEFIECGVEHVSLSTGDEHARFVPVAHVLTAARACASSGLPSTILIETGAGRTINAATIKFHPDFVAIEQAFPHRPPKLFESPWSPLSPRHFGEYAPGETVSSHNLASRGRCEDILSVTTVQADGAISPCCGLAIRVAPELNMGNIEQMSLSAANALAEGNFLNRWIRVEGPERILAWAATHNPEIEWEGRYAHRCQSCIRLFKDPKVRRVIETRRGEKVAEVAFLETLVVPARGDVS